MGCLVDRQCIFLIKDGRGFFCTWHEAEVPDELLAARPEKGCYKPRAFLEQEMFE